MRRFGVLVVGATLLFPVFASAQGAPCQGPGCAAASASCAPLFRGMSGPRVTQLQQVLFAAYANFPTPTGYFGPLTEAAVKQWQVDKGIVSSGSPETTGWGVVGPRTLASMGLCGGSRPNPTPTPTPTPIPTPLPTPTPIPQPTPGNAVPCSFNGSSMPHASAVTVYQSATVPAGQSCLAQTRVCVNGVLSGSYTHLSCTAATAPSTPAQSTLRATPSSGAAPLTVDLAFASSSIAEDINTDCENIRTAPFTGRTFSVDWGDGTNPRNRANKCNPHTYDKKGTYTISARVFDLSNGNPLSDTGSTVWSATTSVQVISGTIASACLALTQDLRPNDTDATTGGEVSKLQDFLSRDTAIYPEGLVTGFYGPATVRAVQRWQAAHKIATSGTPETTGYGAVGPATRASFKKDCAPEAKYTMTPRPASGAPPLTVAFEVFVPQGIYTLVFGDGTSQQVVMPIVECANINSCKNASTTVSHVYNATGEFTAILSNASGAVVTAKVTMGACALPSRDLKLGDTDADTNGQVSVLQRFLIRENQYPEAIVNGIYGPATTRAVERFQKASNISPTGFVGPQTRAAMQAKCDGKPIPNPEASSFKATPVSGAAPLKVDFVAKGFEGREGIVYVIDFGDETKANMTVGTSSLTASRTYSKAGTYKTRLLQVEYLCGGVSGGHGCDRELQVGGITITVTGGTTPPPTACGRFNAGSSIVPGEEWPSCNGQYFVHHQSDGNVVLYKRVTGSHPLALWYTATAGAVGRTSVFVMQTDGNLVLYKIGGTVLGNHLWHSVTHGNPGAFLQVQDDGNMVIYSASNAVLWQSNTVQSGGGVSSSPSNFTTPGTHTFTVPAYSSLTVIVSGGGGGGGASGASITGGGERVGGGGAGTDGGRSSFNNTVIANGGSGGTAGGDGSCGIEQCTNGGNGTAGALGTASGGSANVTGSGAAGGSGGTAHSGGWAQGGNGGAGGAGGRAVRTYGTGALPVGSGITVVVGAGGSSGGHNGSVSISWI